MAERGGEFGAEEKACQEQSTLEKRESILIISLIVESQFVRKPEICPVVLSIKIGCCDAELQFNAGLAPNDGPIVRGIFAG